MITISFVIPLYNEEKAINKLIKELIKVKLPKELKLEEVIFVDDGSNDNSELKIQNSKLSLENKLKAKVKIVSYKQNVGKGYAVRQGMFASKSDYTLFFDADLSTPLDQIEKFLPFMKADTNVLIGTRKNGGSTVIKSQPIYRQLLGRGFTFMSNFILGTSFTDFTCGFKAFRKGAKDKIFRKALINRWGFDSEILFLTKNLDFSFKEVPVVWKNDNNSKVNIVLDIPRSFLELALIRIHNLNLNQKSFFIRALRYAHIYL